MLGPEVIETHRTILCGCGPDRSSTKTCLGGRLRVWEARSVPTELLQAHNVWLQCHLQVAPINSVVNAEKVRSLLKAKGVGGCEW